VGSSASRELGAVGLGRQQETVFLRFAARLFFRVGVGWETKERNA